MKEEDRHWKHISLEAAVKRGMALKEEEGQPFSWLTCTNPGASEVCKAALKVVGVSDAALADEGTWGAGAPTARQKQASSLKVSGTLDIISQRTTLSALIDSLTLLSSRDSI